MGNVAFLVPTEKQEEFNLDSIFDLLNNQFKKFDIVKDHQSNSIEILFKEKSRKRVSRYKNSRITLLEFGSHCYLLEYDDDIKELRERGRNDLADKLEDLKEDNPDLNNSICVWGSFFHDERLEIELFLMRYFGAYLFDEGIHPEFMPPDYEQKPNKSFIRKFGEFLLNKPFNESFDNLPNLTLDQKINTYISFKGVPSWQKNTLSSELTVNDNFFKGKDYDEWTFDDFFEMDKLIGYNNSLFGTRGLEPGDPRRTSRSFNTYQHQYKTAIVRVMK